MKNFHSRLKLEETTSKDCALDVNCVASLECDLSFTRSCTYYISASQCNVSRLQIFPMCHKTPAKQKNVHQVISNKFRHKSHNNNAWKIQTKIGLYWREMYAEIEGEMTVSPNEIIIIPSIFQRNLNLHILFYLKKWKHCLSRHICFIQLHSKTWKDNE